MPKDNACPTCRKPCTSKGGLTLHMNSMHLEMSPSQHEQYEQFALKYRPKDEVCQKCEGSGRLCRDPIDIKRGLSPAYACYICNGTGRVPAGSPTPLPSSPTHVRVTGGPPTGEDNAEGPSTNTVDAPQERGASDRLTTCETCGHTHQNCVCVGCDDEFHDEPAQGSSNAEQQLIVSLGDFLDLIDTGMAVDEAMAELVAIIAKREAAAEERARDSERNQIFSISRKTHPGYDAKEVMKIKKMWDETADRHRRGLKEAQDEQHE